jgi:hypothetical protein
MKHYTVLNGDILIDNFESLEEAEIFALGLIKKEICYWDYEINDRKFRDLLLALKQNDSKAITLYNKLIARKLLIKSNIPKNYKPSKKINDNFNKFLAERLLNT